MQRISRGGVPVILSGWMLATAPTTGAQAGEPRFVDPPAAEGAMAPNVTTGDDGVLLSWIEPAETAEDGRRAARELRLRASRLVGGQWSPPVDIAERHDFFANWADLPSIIQTQDGSLLAHWLQSSGPGIYAYDVIVARSSDEGRTWRTLGPVHSDGTKTEHGFVSLLPEGDSTRVFWLDGREMAGEMGDDHGGADGTGNMTLRTALIGATIGDSIVLDERVCECCDTSAAVTDRGPIVVYRDRSANEVRDIWVVRLVDGRWTEPRAVHDDGWRIAGCPVNGPAVDARGSNVVVAWFTGAATRGAVRLAFSTDAGAHFEPPITIDAGFPLGRVDAVLLPGGEAVVIYLDAEKSEGTITLRRVAPGGGMSAALSFATTSATPASGFPKIAVVGGDLLVVFREVARGEARIRAATIPLSSMRTQAIQDAGR